MAKYVKKCPNRKPYVVVTAARRENILTDLALNHVTQGKLRKTEIAKHNNVALNTIKKYEKNHKEKIAEIEKELSLSMIDKVRELVGAMTSSKIDNCSIPQLAVAAGILTEKSQLLQGKPTEISSDVPSGDAELELFIRGKVPQ